MIIDVDAQEYSRYLDERYKDKNFLEIDILSSLKKVETSNDKTEFKLYSLIEHLCNYITLKLYNDEAEVAQEFAEKCGLLSMQYLDELFEGRIEKYQTDMAIGFIVEKLLEHGLPRIHSISHISQCLEISLTKVRVCNEQFRKLVKEDDYNGHFFNWAWRSYRLLNGKKVDYKHPKAKRAFNTLWEKLVEYENKISQFK